MYIAVSGLKPLCHQYPASDIVQDKHATALADASSVHMYVNCICMYVILSQVSLNASMYLHGFELVT